MARVSPALQSFLDLPGEHRRIGPFHLVEQLGKGGFAPVWLAEEIYGATKLRTAAVKIFSFDDIEARDGARTSSSGERRRALITEEARALCRVEHPNVVRFYALPTDDERGLIGLAMEYVAGTALDRKIAGEAGTIRKLPLAEVLSVGIAVASALAVVHQAGLVHRDIKPANVIEAGGLYKLIDFGIASAERPRAEPVLEAAAEEKARVHAIVLGDVPIQAIGTQADLLLKLQGAQGSLAATSAVTSGTIGYIDPVCMPPTGAPATPASDLYGLGAMLFECITGYLPAVVAAGEGGGLKSEVLDGRQKAPSLRQVSPEAPRALATLVDALLEPVPARRPRSAEAVARDLERIRAELEGKVRALPEESVGPFRGLGRFEETDRDVYFGRSAEAAAALELLRSRGVVALVGPSGSGKSSLARAGVLPAIASGALGAWPKTWDRVIVTPGSDPFHAMREALGPFLGDGKPRSPEAIVAALGERAQTSGRGVLLFVDQLEELATVSDRVDPSAIDASDGATRGSRTRAIELLTRFGDQPLAGVRVLVAARRDLLDPLLALSDELGRVLTRGMLLVSPMADAAWRDVLDQALEAYGYSFEDAALREEILRDLHGTASAMPLVQFALTQLWAQRDVTRKRITRDGFRAIGGIRGAFERHADSTLALLDRKDPHASSVAREVLLALTTAQGTRASRSAEQLADLGGPKTPAILAAFEDARLLTREGAGYALAHEALLTEWAKLREWLGEARGDRLLAEEIERDASRWSETPDASLLLRKRRLATAEEVRRKGTVRLSDIADRYLAVSRQEEQQMRLYVVAAAMLLLVGSVIAATQYVRNIHAARVTAEHNAEEARKNELLAKSSMEKAQQEATRADEAREQARLAMLSADEAKKDFEKSLNDLKAELKKNIDDANALKALAKRVNQLTPSAPPVPSGGSLTGGSVSQTGLPP
jgi:serine/threonine protein kinase